MFSNQLSLITFNFLFLTHRRHGLVTGHPLFTSNATSSNIKEADLNSYSLPQHAQNAQIRATAIATTQAEFSYGPPVAGGPSFPSGDIGKARVAADMALEMQEAVPVITMSTSDSTQAMNDTSKYDGLKTVEDYIKLYDGEWTQTLPTGLAPGVLTNYTQDLMFSMVRLSTSPFAIRRLNPSSESLAFEVDTSIVQNMSGMTLEQLFDGGRLFYVDHSYQKDMSRTERYAAACDTYFFIDNTTGNFLPLAIRTGVGANLIYTPLDEQADWQLAKIMFNVKDFVFSQMHHLGAMHEVLHDRNLDTSQPSGPRDPAPPLLRRLRPGSTSAI